MELAAKAIGLVTDTAVVAGVVWPYIAQARELRRTKDVESYSRMTSCILVVSGILRVLYYFSLPAKQKFGTPLLVQAIASVFTQLWFMSVVVELQSEAKAAPVPSGAGAALARRPAPGTGERSLLGGDLIKHFWAWDDTVSYLVFAMTLFTGGFVLSSQLHAAFPWYAGALGLAALGIEATLPLPQLLRNAARKSTEGLSPLLVGSWLAGDAFKTGYALLKSEPLPFLLCGAFQLSVDVLLALQMTLLYPPRHGHGAGVKAAGGAGGTAGSMPRPVSGGLEAWLEHAVEEDKSEIRRAEAVLAHEGMQLRARGAGGGSTSSASSM